MTDATIVRTGPDHRAALRASTFGDVLRSEWTKFRSVRSTFWALTVTVVLGIVLGAVISAATAHSYARFSVSQKLTWDPTGVSGAGMAIAQLAIAVLGVLCISSEYSSGMIRTSLIAVPKRGRVLAAKSLVFAGVTFVVGEVTIFVAFFVGQALISGHAPHAALGDPGVARAVLGGGLYLTALAVLSVAAGTLLRRPAAAIACMMAVLLVLPGIAQALPDSWRNPVTEFWPTQAGSQLTSVYHSAHTLQPWPGFGVMCLFVAIVYAVAWTLLDRRDALGGQGTVSLEWLLAQHDLDQADRRRLAIALSPAGHEFLDRYRDPVNALESRMLHGTTKPQVTALRRTLTTCHANLAPGPAPITVSCAGSPHADAGLAGG